MEKLTVAMKFKQIVIEIEDDQLTKEGREILAGNSKKSKNFLNTVFVIGNGSYDEIFDDSEDDEVEASKTITTINAVEPGRISVAIESEFSFNVFKKLTTKQLLEWQDENDPFGFGFTLSINPQFLMDPDDSEPCEFESLFDELSISVI
ncbi:MAG: hypothetical protein HOK52_07100 [Candidatus Marinimicrobia bacterium]|mgnify:CR=1 FL=1|jgi:hypothetical protein|nr:hypothetical protein [Candidatus Neomarinimicrobiota bacterium]